jgi:predicted metal-dependent phosphoesterase TrpH
LHLHTLASDGFWTPETLTEHLTGRGFRVAAVCDHDTQRSVAETIRLGAARGVAIIPGVEVTSRWEERQLHVLVYGVRPDRDDANAWPFQRLMGRIDAELNTNAEDARERFEASGRALPSLEEIRAGRVLWPFHVLSAAIKDGHAPNLKESAELLLQLGGRFTADLPIGEVVYASHRAGGLCLIAHPGRDDAVGVVTEADLDRLLSEHPIDGLEAHYRSHTAEQTRHYRALAEERGLLVSAGSDSHAPNMPVYPKPWRAAWSAALLQRLGFVIDLDPSEPVWTPEMEPLAAAPAPAPEQADTPEETLSEAKREQPVAARGD